VRVYVRVCVRARAPSVHSACVRARAA
jgi:hypothetical protein